MAQDDAAERHQAVIEEQQFFSISLFFLNSNPYTDYPLSILVEEPPSCFVDFLLVEFQWFFIQKLDSHLKKTQCVSSCVKPQCLLNDCEFKSLQTSIPIQVGEAEAARLRAEIEELVQRVPLVPK
jgi:hypothetical protein